MMMMMMTMTMTMTTTTTTTIRVQEKVADRQAHRRADKHRQTERSLLFE